MKNIALAAQAREMHRNPETYREARCCERKEWCVLHAPGRTAQTIYPSNLPA